MITRGSPDERRDTRLRRLEFFPAICAEAILASFDAMGLDVARIRAAADLPAPPSDAATGGPRAMLSEQVWARLWVDAYTQAPRVELAAEAGLAVPFGAFGTLDYLSGSAETLAGAVAALLDHLVSIASSFRLRLGLVDPGLARLEIVPVPGGCTSIEEFVLATLVGRFRDLAGGRFALRAVGVRAKSTAVSSRHDELFGAPVSFGTGTGYLEFDQSSLESPLRTADPRLHGVLRGLASQLSLGRGAQTSDLELAIHGRLRDLMRGRDVSANAVARSLGMSERTLHRRLGELGRRYQDVVDACREAEAERLLLGGEANLLDVAHALGFSDQSAFNRAFRRWKQLPPTKWLAAQASRTASNRADA